MKISFRHVLWIFSLIVLSGCQSQPYVENEDHAGYLHRAAHELTDVIVHDIFSPPVASRIYAYASIAAYEVAIQQRPDMISLSGRLNELTPVPETPDSGTWSPTLAAVHAFLTTGKALIFSEIQITDFQDTLYPKIKEQLGIPQRVYNNSIAYGQQVAEHILAWSDGDNYKKTRTNPKYTITTDPGKWQPTPPAYMEGIEPSWNEIRPFTLDSATQYRPPPPTDFSIVSESQFYKEAMEVVQAADSIHADYPTRIEIAQFWDCNPYVSHQHGHVMFATKKITPGGHWMGIAGQACRQRGLYLAESARVYAYTAIALADGFISCWDEKYRSNLIRPETYINKYIDPDWRPVLQTPPFPEHTSGHSVISSAAGEMLTALLGDQFAFTDSVELEYGLPLRHFSSFREAYHEAAVSRLYGGIHYRPAIDVGVKQGQALGTYIVEKLVQQ